MATTQLTANQPPAKQQDLIPTRKVTAGGVAGAASIIIVFALNNYVLPQDKPLTAEVAAALTTFLSFVIAYLVPPAASDQVTVA
jgi:hypothetical protein